MGGEGQLKNIIRLGGTETGRDTREIPPEWSFDWVTRLDWSYITKADRVVKIAEENGRQLTIAAIGTETGRVTVKGGVDWAKHPDGSFKYEYSHYTPPGKNAVMMEGDICSHEGFDLLKSRLPRPEDMIDMAVEYKDGKAVRLVPMTEIETPKPPTRPDVLTLAIDDRLFGRIKFGMHLKDAGQLKTIIKL